VAWLREGESDPAFSNNGRFLLFSTQTVPGAADWHFAFAIRFDLEPATSLLKSPPARVDNLFSPGTAVAT
jgi:hypothetical protein